jgi:hypothetical protein
MNDKTTVLPKEQIVIPGEISTKVDCPDFSIKK